MEVSFKARKFADIAEKTAKEIVEVLFGKTPESFNKILGETRTSVNWTWI